MIDLRSDTVTAPDQDMRAAAKTADVGDDVYGEDPTVNDLEARAAEVLGTGAALFVPSGTMANQIAARVLTDRGQEVICERDSHVYRWELAGLAQHAACQTRPVTGTDRGALTPAQVRDALVTADDHRPGTGLLALENTHNAAGGTALSPGTIEAAATAARERDVPVHLDGARLWNAAVAHDVSPARFVEPVDTVACALSKGLGAPVGSILAGSAAVVDAARRVRKLFGGGWRQAGIVAAPGLVALERRDRLAADHDRARRLADGLDDVDGLSAREPETNIVLVETERPAEALQSAYTDAGVGCAVFGERLLRFTTHRDVDDEDIATAIDRVASAH